MPKRQPRRYTVRGFGQFPIDMLRYDGAYPASSKDAAEIERSFREHRAPFGEADSNEPFVVELVQDDPPSIPPGDDNRWRSFGWGVQL